MAFPTSQPLRLHIPTLDVDGEVINLGLKSDGSMEVPPDGKQAGWYTESPSSGEVGPAIIAAHVDWHGPGIFFRLHEMNPSDRVTVDRSDGTSVEFEVARVEQYPKDAFPTDKVYGNVPNAQLRLITCGGDSDPAAGSYVDNIVIYARMAI